MTNRTLPPRSLFLLLLLCVVGVLSASITHAAPLRVLPNERTHKIPRVQVFTEFLYERLHECAGVDVVEGGRASRVYAFLRSGAFDMSEEACWQELVRLVDIDAMVSVATTGDQTAEAASVAVEVRLFRAGGMTVVRGEIDGKDGGAPSVTSLAAKVARELKLPDGDVRLLSEPRLDDPSLFARYYGTRYAYASWPVNAFTGPFLGLVPLRNEKPNEVGDAIAVHIIAGYLDLALHGRNSEKAAQAVSMLRAPALRLLATPHESEVLAMARLAPSAGNAGAAAGFFADFESVLLQIVQPIASVGSAKPVSESELEDLESVKPVDKRVAGDAIAKPSELGARVGQSEFTKAQQISALRVLAAMRSARALKLFEATAKSPDAALRAVTATSLSEFKDDAGEAILTQLAGDPDRTVAFEAGRTRSKRGKSTGEFVQLATSMLDGPDPMRLQAALALAADKSVKDPALLARLAADNSPRVRLALRRTRADRLGDAPVAQQLAAALRDPDTAVVLAATSAAAKVKLSPGDEAVKHLRFLTNDPDPAVAQAARDALAPLRPAAGEARLRFDLAAGSPYHRHRAIEAIRASAEPWALEPLREACNNPEPHTRLAALRALSERDPAAGLAAFASALSDPHLYVRFHAAAEMAAKATAAQVPVIKATLALQRDRATRLYLQDALARLGEGAAPPPQPPANTLSGEKTIVSISGPNTDEPGSPFRAHFKPSHGNHVRDDEIPAGNKRAHAEGKAYYYNVGPLGEPGAALVDPTGLDRDWIYLDDQLDTVALDFIDGVDLGNGSLAPDALWPLGWRYFCEEAGIDPGPLAGKRENLGPAQLRAWRVWAARRCVEGRNRLYDYVKLKFGRLHPGFQVIYPLGGTGDPALADLKFDVGMTRSDGDNHPTPFALIRHARTIWPERPVLWFGEALNVPNLAIIKYDFQPPSAPLVGRQYSAYVDALAAWMAGGDPGWSFALVLRRWDWSDSNDFAAAIVMPEDARADSPVLKSALDYAFANVEPVIREKDALAKTNKKGPTAPLTDDETKIDGLVESIAKPDAGGDLKERIGRDRARMARGFIYYGKHVLDMARLFASLPRNAARRDTLLIQPLSNEARPVVASPGASLLNDYDRLFEVDELDRLDLSHYRFIALASPSDVTDETIAKVTAWLRDTPGILYVHRELPAENSRISPSPERLGKSLKNDWPWENDLTIQVAASSPASLSMTATNGDTVVIPSATIARRFEIRGDATKVLLRAGDAPTLIVWRGVGFKGAVVFDAVEGGGDAYPALLNGTLNELKASLNVGVTIDGMPGHEAVESSRWRAEVAVNSAPRVIPGVDLLTGERDPVVGPGRLGAMVIREFQGRFAAAGNGVSVLCDKPIRSIQKVDGGLVVECDGLIQAASVTGACEVLAKGGGLPAISESDRLDWIFMAETPGVASAKQAKANSAASTVYHIRSPAPVTIRVAK